MLQEEVGSRATLCVRSGRGLEVFVVVVEKELIEKRVEAIVERRHRYGVGGARRLRLERKSATGATEAPARNEPNL